MSAMLNVNKDMLKERRTSTFNVEKLINIIDGGKESTQTRREIQRRALQEPLFVGGPDISFLSREELYDTFVQRSTHVQKLLRDWNLSTQEKVWLTSIAYGYSGAPDGVHDQMFTPALENQSTDDQKEKWLAKAYNRNIIGTYIQTELGHGNHLRGLETTATYDPSTEEFVLNTPTLTATKWWPGGLGKTTNCGVLMAQLYSRGQNYGIYGFFVMFRDPDTHQPLPGVTVGDIGPKMGINSNDNGFLRLNNFRIPRENMLMKHAEVLRDGSFVSKTKQKKPTYSAMTLMRTTITESSSRALSIALTIAIRYSAIRRQSELNPGAPEPQILDYQTQQYKLFPYLAMTYGFKFAAENLRELFVKGMRLSQAGDGSIMPELHALSSGLKAYCTGQAAIGIEQARLSCGGHGYSEASGLPKLYCDFSPSCTVEGDNSVLFLQTARYLLKCYELIKSNISVPNSVVYLQNHPTRNSAINGNADIGSLVDLFEHRAQRLITEIAGVMRKLQDDGLDEFDARNRSAVHLTRATIAHCEFFIIKSFAEKVASFEDKDIAEVMKQLCQLLAIYTILNKSGDFLADGYISPIQLQQLREKEAMLLSDIRPNAVSLVDAFDYPDGFLKSILGRYDGNVYENLYKWALESPLNKTQVHGSYYKYLQPMMKSRI